MISHGLCQQKRCILLKVPNYISVITRKVFLQLQNYNQAAKEKKKGKKEKIWKRIHVFSSFKFKNSNLSLYLNIYSAAKKYLCPS